MCLGLTGQTHSMRAALFPLLLRDDWQLSCLHHCRVIFVRSHPFDRGSEGLLSQEMAYCFSALQSITCRRALPVISFCLLSVLIYITFSHIKEQYTLSFIIIITQASSLYHLPTLLLLQKQRSMYPRGFSVMIISLSRLFARKTIYIPVICSCIKLLSHF